MVYPQAWRYTRGARQGVTASAALTLASGTGFMAATGWDPEALRSVGPIAVAGLLCSLLMGVWISRIIDQ